MARRVMQQEIDGNPVEGLETLALPQALENLQAVDLKTDLASHDALDRLDVPHPSDTLSPHRLTEVPSVAQAVSAAAVTAGVVEPNLALEAVKAALKYEGRAIRQLRDAEQETDAKLKIIDQMLDLSSELASLKEGDTYELSDKVRDMLNDLKTNQGIDLLKGEAHTITKEQLIELKSSISARVDNTRSKVQQIFTKMHNIVQNMISVNDSGKRLINEFSNLLQTISRNMRP